MTTLGQKRLDAQDRRKLRVLALLKEGRPPSAIAEIIGLNYEQCRDMLSKLRREQGLPNSRTRDEGLPVGVTQESHSFRAQLGAELYAVGEKGDHAVDIAGVVGVPPQSQPKATQRPFHYNWSLGQIERLAGARNTTFRNLVLRSLLSPEEYRAISQCIKI